MAFQMPRVYLLVILASHTCVMGSRPHMIQTDLSTERHQMNTSVKDSAEWREYYKCPCSRPFKDAENCCERTDEGSGFWKEGDHATCQPVHNEKAETNECKAYCDYQCEDVPHKDDKEKFHEYLWEKIKEVPKMGMADYLMGVTAFVARTYVEKAEPQIVPVSEVHALHPVGSWRPHTWNKTLGRRDAVLAAKSRILQDGLVLTEEATNTVPELLPMRSITAFDAVPLGFCGVKTVFLEGNGRMKGIKLAAAMDPDLANIKVEVGHYMTYRPDRKRMLQKAILKQWNQYIEDASEMDPVTQAAEIKEYMSFKIGVVKCRGIFQAQESLVHGCPVVSNIGDIPGHSTTLWSAGDGDMIGVSEKFRVASDATEQFLKDHLPDTSLLGNWFSSSEHSPRALLYYKLCDSSAGKPMYLVADDEGEVVKEYCEKCIDEKAA